jgi:metal-responsive CopG/Arc/MetJ family transcriptional regulator
MPNQRSDKMKCKTVSLPKKLLEKTQKLADLETEGDFSQVVREALEKHIKEFEKSLV